MGYRQQLRGGNEALLGFEFIKIIMSCQGKKLDYLMIIVLA